MLKQPGGDSSKENIRSFTGKAFSKPGSGNLSRAALVILLLSLLSVTCKALAGDQAAQPLYQEANLRRLILITSLPITPVIEAKEEAPAFGRINFSSGLGMDMAPVGVSVRFDEGVVRLYGVFPYRGMKRGIHWRCEWLQNGKAYSQADIEWVDGEDGISWCSTTSSDGRALNAGVYQLNLYIGEKLAQSGQVVIMPGGFATATPHTASVEELVDRSIMPAWERLADSPDDKIREIARLVQRYQIKISPDSNISNAAAMYYCEVNSNKPGEVHVSPRFMNEHPLDEVTSVIAHELVHAYQDVELKQCGCSKYNEVVAHTIQIYTLVVFNRWDIIDKKFRWAYDDQNRFSADLIWKYLAADPVYQKCQDYFP
jgi:hypothetical protein